MNRAGGVQYFLEHLPNLQTVQITLNADCAESLKVTFKKYSVLLGNGICLIDWIPVTFPSISTSDLSNLRFTSKDGLCARFRTHHQAINELCAKETLLQWEERVLQLGGNNTDHASNPIQLNCGFCDKLIFRQRFHRVLPLPSVDWVEVMGDVFCHPHSHGSSREPDGDCVHKLKQGMVAPKRGGDMLVGDGQVVVQASVMTSCRTAKSAIVCERCHSEIGRMDVDTNSAWIKLLKVHLSSEGPTHSTKSRCSDVLLLQNQLVCNILKTIKDIHCFSFIVKCNGRKVIKLNTLGTLSLVITNANSNHVSHHFQGSHESSPPSTNPKKILKVFFTSLLDDSSNAEGPSVAAREEEPIEALEMSSEECNLLRLALMENHLSLPPSFRNTHNKKISYLEASSSET